MRREGKTDAQACPDGVVLLARATWIRGDGWVSAVSIAGCVMRDYAKVSPQFWTGATGKSLRGDPDAVIVAMYLMTSPHANMIGLYHLPKLYIAHETGLTIEGASKGLQRCIEALFCTYDEASEHVFVHEMARFQIGDSLDIKDKRCKGVENELEKCPKGALQHAFREKYASAFHLAPSKGLPRGKKAPTKPRAGTRTGTGTGTEPCSADAERFDRFYSAYPKKVAKEAAQKAFAKVDPDDDVLGKMLAALAVQKQSAEWQKENGQFIPHPATWINGKRWLDEQGASSVQINGRVAL
jgi:hypothetical protein